ncbi:hypothetical protein K3495_g2471 [Podosphaera aphanis]|nr:hypothetical protein K3495_g2471 [Podosphaera aphanis]
MNHIRRPAYQPCIRDLVNSFVHPSPRPVWHRPSRTTRPLSTHRASPQRPLTTSSSPNVSVGRRWLNSAPAISRDRGPPSAEETQTDFGTLDVYRNTPPPSTAIDACVWDGFHLNNGVRVLGGMGVLLVAGEAFSWQPWRARDDAVPRLCNARGQWEVDDAAWGLLELVWPRPDLLVLGLGPEMRLVSPTTRHRLNHLGIRLEVQDTRNAAAQFNLLATERGLSNVAAALIPIGWKEGLGASSDKST